MAKDRYFEDDEWGYEDSSYKHNKKKGGDRRERQRRRDSKWDEYE